MSKVIVEYLKSSGAFGVGTRAGYGRKQAEALVARGLVKIVSIGGQEVESEPDVIEDGGDPEPKGDSVPKPDDDVEDPLAEIRAEIAAAKPWTEMNGNTLKSIAKKLAPDVPVTTKADAIGVIEAALKAEDEQAG